MVRITNGEQVIEVTRGVFKETYSRQGWHLADEHTPTTPIFNEQINGKQRAAEMKVISVTPIEDPTLPQYKEVKIYHEQEKKPEPQADDGIYVPLSEMNVEELKQYAKTHGVNISSAKKKQEIIDLIADSAI